MPLSFEPLKLPDAALFGVRLSGAIGRRDRQRLLELADRCLEKQKTHLILDVALLATLGGGAAGILADLQRRLLEQGGTVVFVGANDVVCHFLAKRFADVPLRCVPTLAAAISEIGDVMESSPTKTASAPAARSAAARIDADVVTGRPSSGLDGLLEGIDAASATDDDASRLTADVVTAPFLSLSEALEALRATENPMAFGEALGNLLHNQDLAAETIYLARQGDELVAVHGAGRLPMDGVVAAAMAYATRPLTLLDLEDGDLADAETLALETLQPDLLLPVRRDGVLRGVAVLKRGKDDPEYGLAENFALELLLRALTSDQEAAVGGHAEACQADPSAEASVAEASAAEVPAAESASDAAEYPASAGDDLLLQTRLNLARDLARAQDETHFWQILQQRLAEVARVRSMLCIDVEGRQSEPFLAGAARGRQNAARLDGERILAFFRTLERPVEVRNMPHFFAQIRDGLLDLDLDWVVGLNVEGRCLGAAMLGLQWRTAASDVQDQLAMIMDVVVERLAALRDAQRHADFSLKLVETLVNRAETLAGEDPQASRLLAEHVRLLSREMGLPPDQERDLVLGALLRNVGQATTPLITDREGSALEGPAWELYRRHPDRGADQLEDLRAPAALCDAVRHHHERYDGTGFPHGLASRGIPLPARMVAVVQAYVTSITEGNGEPEEALGAITSLAGEVLDPDLVDLFAHAVRRRVAEVGSEVVPA